MTERIAGAVTMNVPFGLPLLFAACEDLLPPDGGTDAKEPPEKRLLARADVLAGRVSASAAAGAGAVCAPTVGAGRICLERYGARKELEDINAGLVRAVRAAVCGSPAGRQLPVGGILGPSGLFVPPFGEDDFDDIYSIYKEQIAALKDGGADFLLLSRQTSLADMRAALLAARHTDLPVFVCIAVDETGKTLTGASLLPVLITLQSMGVAADAVGLCASPSSEAARTAFESVLPHACVPLILLADARPGETPEELAAPVLPLLKAGVCMVGTGYAAGPEHLGALRDAIKKSGLPAAGLPPEYPEKPDCYAAATEQEAFFLGDDIVFSEPVRCSSLLEDHLIHLEDERVSAALVEVTSVADAEILASGGSIAKLPVAVHADNATVLEAALRYFQGRLIVDSKCLIERESLEPLAAKYGAIIY